MSAAAGEQFAPELGEVTLTKPTRLQRVVARRMAESSASVPDFSVTVEIDMSLAAAVRRRLREVGRSPVPSFNDMVVLACARALRAHPLVNASYADGAVATFSAVNVGIAVAAEDGLLVPVILRADERSLQEIASVTRRLAERARARTLTPAELSGGTFTVSNLGMFGVQSFSAIVNPPQAAILAVGAIRNALVPRDGHPAEAKLMTATLVSDHRVVYGADAARFLATLRETLEAPGSLLEGR